MAKEPRPKGYPKLKNYKPSQFMLPTSHYDKKKADRAVTFIENLCHTKGKWAGTPFWLLPWQELSLFIYCMQITNLQQRYMAQLQIGSRLL